MIRYKKKTVRYFLEKFRIQNLTLQTSSELREYYYSVSSNSCGEVLATMLSSTSHGRPAQIKFLILGKLIRAPILLYNIIFEGLDFWKLLFFGQVYTYFV